MSDNAQKQPFSYSISRFAEKKVLNAIQLLGKALPATVVSNDNSIVTVNFEIVSDFTLPQVTMPMFGPEYVRYPIKSGDKGVVIPADAYLGGMSGLGGGTADLSQRANLSALLFLPISNTAWFEVDPDAVTIYGPNGVVLQNTDATSTLVLHPTGVAIMGQDEITFVVGTTEIEITSAGVTITGDTTINGGLTVNGHTQGNGDLTTTGEVTADGIPLSTHHHGGVTTGGGNTAGPAA